MEVGDDGRPGLEGCGIEEEGKIVRGGRAGGREVMEREVCSETKSEKAQQAPTLVFAFPEKGVVPDRNVPSEQESDHPWFVLAMRGKEAACWTLSWHVKAGLTGPHDMQVDVRARGNKRSTIALAASGHAGRTREASAVAA